MTTLETLEKLANTVQAEAGAIMQQYGSYDGSDNSYSCGGTHGAYIEGLDRAHDLLSQAIAKIKPVPTPDCQMGDCKNCDGECPALWPDGEVTVRKCSCACHTKVSR